MRTFSIGAITYAEDTPAFLAAIEKAYDTNIRPACRCTNTQEGIACYIAKIEGSYIVKRMPETGDKHAYTCVSHDPPSLISGKAALIDRAIHEVEGNDEVRCDFAMKKTSGRAPPVTSGSPSEVVADPKRKLTILALLHFLWDKTELTHWRPFFSGKRYWSYVRAQLVEAAKTTIIKGEPLVSMVYIPAPYVDTEERKKEIQAEQNKVLAFLRTNKNSRMILIGELKSIEKKTANTVLTLAHAGPKFSFLIASDFAAKVQTRFSNALALADTLNTNDRVNIKIIVIATFWLDSNGFKVIEEISCMAVTASSQDKPAYIPVENSYDADLITGLAMQKRSFKKALRYNASKLQMPVFGTLSDDGCNTALFIIPDDMPEDEHNQVVKDANDEGIPLLIVEKTALTNPKLPNKIG